MLIYFCSNVKNNALTNPNMKTKSIKQTVTFNAPSDRVYHLLMNEKKHAAFTGSKAIMSNKVNGKFDVFAGYCHGYNIELEEGKKIIQAWHFNEEGWPEDHYSICTFLFEQVDNKTKMTFFQTGVPEESVESLKGGWKEFYWEAMKDFLKKE